MRALAALREMAFVKTPWVNDGVFIGAPDEKDPLLGSNDDVKALHTALPLTASFSVRGDRKSYDSA